MTFWLWITLVALLCTCIGAAFGFLVGVIVEEQRWMGRPDDDC